jgi:hypothetical protein
MIAIETTVRPMPTCGAAKVPPPGPVSTFALYSPWGGRGCGSAGPSLRRFRRPGHVKSSNLLGGKSQSSRPRRTFAVLQRQDVKLEQPLQRDLPSTSVMVWSTVSTAPIAFSLRFRSKRLSFVGGHPPRLYIQSEALQDITFHLMAMSPTPEARESPY